MTQSDRNRDLSAHARDDFDEHDDEELTRAWHRPRTGTKVTTLMGLSLFACAVYFLFAPVYMDTANGWFGCGNFIQGSDVEFVNEVCKGAPNRNLALALLAGALAVIIGGLGAFLFGFDTEIEHRRVPLGYRDRDGRPDHSSRDDGSERDDRGLSRSRDDDDRPTRARRARSAWDD